MTKVKDWLVAKFWEFRFFVADPTDREGRITALGFLLEELVLRVKAFDDPASEHALKRWIFHQLLEVKSVRGPGRRLSRHNYFSWLWGEKSISARVDLDNFAKHVRDFQSLWDNVPPRGIRLAVLQTEIYLLYRKWSILLEAGVIPSFDNLLSPEFDSVELYELDNSQML